MSDDLVKRLKKWGAFGYGVEASATMIEAADEIERLRALAAPPAAPGEQAKSRVDREGGFNAARMYYGDEFAREPSPFVPPPAAPAGGEIDLLIIELRDDAERSFKDAYPEAVIRIYENERNAAAAALAALQERANGAWAEITNAQSVAKHCMARADAAEARVKALEKALERIEEATRSDLHKDALVTMLRGINIEARTALRSDG